MKKLLAIFLLITGSLQAQNFNSYVLEFVDSTYGERVGAGICMDLFNGAATYAREKTGIRDSVMDDVVLGDLKPGDIIDFDSVMCADGHFIKNHVGIVYRVHGNILSIADQNNGPMEAMIEYEGHQVPLAKDSKVGIHIFDLSEVVSGKVSFYRL